MLLYASGFQLGSAEPKVPPVLQSSGSATLQVKSSMTTPFFFLFIYRSRQNSQKKCFFFGDCRKVPEKLRLPAAFSQRLQDPHTFYGTNAEDEKLEGTLDVVILRQIVMGFLEPLNVSLGIHAVHQKG